MKRLTLSEWEQKYIVKPIERFDQKYSMFRRYLWDPDIKGLLKSWYHTGEIIDKPGYTQLDLALKHAYRRTTQALLLFNIYKPNVSSVSSKLTELATSLMGKQALDYRSPGDAKVDVSDPQRITRIIRKVAIHFGADLVGICRLDRRWLYSHTYERVGAVPGEDELGEYKSQEIPEEFQYAVVMGFEEDYDLMKYFPTWIAQSCASEGYSRMAITSARLAAFIRNLGFHSIDGTCNDVALSIPMAMQAGLGELGRNGLLITPHFGPRLRIEKVITDLPLIADVPMEFGVTEFCSVCKKCANMCPSQAIMHGERTTEPRNISNAAGELKWPVDAERCRIYWSRINRSCTTCIACCPYNKPDTWLHRTVGWFTDNVRWADSFYARMDDLFGYGKPKEAGNFWDEWQPRRHG